MKSLAINTLKAGVTIGVLYWIIYQFGWNTITSTLKSANPLWIGVGVTLFVVSVILGALQWRILLKTRGIDLPLGQTISIYFTGIFLNNFMLGMIAGDSYKVAHLHFNNKKAENSFAATFFDRVAGLLTISFFALAGGLYLFLHGESSAENLNGVLVIALGFALLLMAFVSLFVSRRVQKLAHKLLSFIPSNTLKQHGESILKALFIDRHNKEEKQTFTLVLFYSFWIQLLRILVHVCAAASLGMFSLATVHYFFIIIPVVAFLTIIPLPLGIKEAVGGTLFLAAGFNHEQAVVMEFLATLMGIGGSLFGGLTLFLNRNKGE